MTDTKENQEQNSEEILKESAEVVEEQAEAPEATPEEASEKKEEVSTEAQIETLQQEVNDYRDRMLRIAADSENFKKRMERDKETLIKYAGENILRDLLDTLDNLDRAIEQGRTDSEDNGAKLTSMLEGLELTRKGLLTCLEKYDVSALNSVGEPFNPNEQEALTMEPSEEVAANHVIREYVKGYRFKDRLLRAAKVTVSSGSSS